jgi:hypothetical protein
LEPLLLLLLLLLVTLAVLVVAALLLLLTYVEAGFNSTLRVLSASLIPPTPRKGGRRQTLLIRLWLPNGSV